MTDTKTSNRIPTDDHDDKTAAPKRLLDLSATQLVGGALAAMTSAVIGAQLGVAGTILGAAIGSIVAGVAGSLYTLSLKHTKDKISSAFVGRVGDTKVEVTTVSEDTAVLDGWDTTASPGRPSAAIAPPSHDAVADDALVDERGKPARQLPWKPIMLSAAAVFLIAIAAITGFELVSGQAISGGEGTTISQVSEGRGGGSDAPSEAPSSTPSSETSIEPSSPASASAEPSSETTTEPSSEPTTSSEPSSESTQTSDPSTGSEPTTGATPTTADGSAAGDSDDGGTTGG